MRIKTRLNNFLYSSLLALLALGISTCTIIEGDSAGGGSGSDNPAGVAGIEVSPNTLTVEETDAAGKGTDTFTVVLSGEPTDYVYIEVGTSDIDEALVSQESGTPVEVITLAFHPGNWNITQSVLVTGQKDQADDGDQVATIQTNSASSADSRYSGLNPSDVTVTVTDGDTGAATLFPASGLTTTEAGGTDPIKIVMGTKPSADVVFTLTSSDATEGKLSSDGGTTSDTSAAVTFTIDNWQTEQTITLVGQDDDLRDGNIDYTIGITASSTDTVYSALTFTDITATNNDDPAPTLPASEDGVILQVGDKESKLYKSVSNSASPYGYDPLLHATFDVTSPELSTSVMVLEGISLSGFEFFFHLGFDGNIPDTYTDNNRQLENWLTGTSLSDQIGYISFPNFTTGMVTVDQYGAVNQTISGSFDAGVCAVTELRTTYTCTPLKLVGSFQVTRAPDEGKAVNEKADIETNELETLWINTTYNAGAINYMESEVDAGKTYQVELWCLDYDVDLFVWANDENMSSSADCSQATGGTVTEKCTGLTPTGSELYFQVKRGSGVTNSTIKYDVRVSRTDSGWQVAEGSPRCPVAVSSFPDSTVTVDTDASYYQATGLTPNTSYTVTISDMDEDIDLEVYNTINFDTQGANALCYSDLGDTSQDSCAATSTGGGVLYIKVVGDDGPGYDGTTFTLNVQ